MFTFWAKHSTFRLTLYHLKKMKMIYYYKRLSVDLLVYAKKRSLLEALYSSRYIFDLNFCKHLSWLSMEPGLIPSHEYHLGVFLNFSHHRRINTWWQKCANTSKNVWKMWIIAVVSLTLSWSSVMNTIEEENMGTRSKWNLRRGFHFFKKKSTPQWQEYIDFYFFNFWCYLYVI